MTEMIEHNADAYEDMDSGEFMNFSVDQLNGFIRRIENLEEEKAALLTDIREIYSDAKSVGFDVKIMRKIIKMRKLTDEQRQEEAYLTDTYMRALGMDLC